MDDEARESPGVGGNTYAGSPPMVGLGRFDEFEVVCRGEVSASPGYLIDIKVIDRAVRDVVVPRLKVLSDNPAAADPAGFLGSLVSPVDAWIRSAVGGSGARLDTIRWRLTPYYSIECSTDRPMHAQLRQRFDFAASHRLHVPSLSPDENRRLFGKCNHPSGHGHNYQFELAVNVPLSGEGGHGLLARIEREAKAAVLDRFDHTHLNLDTEEFRDGSGVNPTVENIAWVIFSLLEPRIRGLGPGVALDTVTVWETDRTCATVGRDDRARR
ncbi:MAG: 6-carboxytetrahydropterin synthase [Phycisphaeraceae bacterium]|nr:MAG: 6-carboxytetrahydropterin synthase [Phycisphaeraceae bacterium]